MKKILLSMVLVWISLFSISYWANDFEIIPKAKEPTTIWDSVNEVWKDWWKVWETYNKKAESMNDLNKVWDQFATGIMTWDTLIHYVIYLVRFISQIGLLIWWVMIIYAWYLYSTTVFGWWDASKWNKAIKDAIIWILIVSFSYAIMKFLTAAFLT